MVFWKEWREAIRTLPIAMLVLAVVMYVRAPARSLHLNDPLDEYATALALWGSVYALLLGLLQTWTEQRTDVRGWLLSHPVNRWKVFWAKTIAAFLVYVAAVSIPWTVSYFWLVRVAPQTRPVEASILIPALLSYLAAFSFHPAAIWMMSRPARWIGSKICVLTLPMLATSGAVAALQLNYSWFGITSILSVVAFGIFAFPSIAGDAYTRLTNQPVSSAGTWRSGLASLGLIASVAALGGIGLAAIWGVVASQVAPVGQAGSENVRFTPAGRPVSTIEQYRWDDELGQSTYQVTQGKLIPPVDSASDTVNFEVLEPYPESKFAQLLNPESFSNLGETSVWNPFNRLTHMSYYSSRAGMNWIYHDDGYYLIYADPNSVGPDEDLLVATLDRSGFDQTVSPFSASVPMNRFSRAEATNWTQPPTKRFHLADRDGIYLASLLDKTIEPVLKTKIDELCLMGTLGDRGPTAIVMHGNELKLFDVASAEPGKTLPPALSKKQVKRGEYAEALPQLSITNPSTINLPQDWFPHQEESRRDFWTYHSCLDLGEQGFVVIQLRWQHSIKLLRISNDQKQTQQTFPLPKQRAPTHAEFAANGILPPVVNLSLGAMQLTNPADTQNPPEQPGKAGGIVLVGAILHVVVAWALTIVACRRRAVTAKQTWLWCFVSLVAGVVAPLIVLSHYSRLAWQSCSHCERQAKVNEPCCPHCQADWSSPERTGIEVFAGEAPEELSSALVRS